MPVRRGRSGLPTALAKYRAKYRRDPDQGSAGLDLFPYRWCRAQVTSLTFGSEKSK